MSVMDDLIRFLRARLAERERIALAACYWPDDPCHWLTKHDHWVRRFADEDSGDQIVRTTTGVEHRPVEAMSLDPIPVGWVVTHTAAVVPQVGDSDMAIRLTRHFADNDPAWVLADVESKRQVIQLYENAVSAMRAGSISYRNRTQDEAAVDVLGAAVKSLALPYAGRDDYDESWKP